jgi:hypothetical protein
MKARGLAKWGGAVALGAAMLLGLGAGSAGARVLYRDSFEKAGAGGSHAGGVIAPTLHGKGWKADFSGTAGNRFQGPVIDLDEVRKQSTDGMRQGTISLWIQRNERVGTRDESLLSITDANFTPLMSMVIQWEWREPNAPPYPLLQIDSDPNYPLWGVPVVLPPSSGGTILWSNQFAMKNIGKSQWYNLSLTWGPADNDCAIYLDGAKLKAVPLPGFAMNKILEDASHIVVGAVPVVDPAKLNVKAKGVPGDLPLVRAPSNSLIDAVEIRDTIEKSLASVYTETDDLRIDSVEHNAFKKSGFAGKLVAGNALDVQVIGAPGVTATFDIAHYPDLERKIDLNWSGWGVYLENKTFYDAGEVNLRDVDGYQVYVSKAPFDPAAPGMAPLQELDVKVQKYTVETLEIDTPYYVGVVAKMRDGSFKTVLASPMGLPMREVTPGVYDGVWDVTYQDHFRRAIVVGHVGQGGATLSLAGGAKDAFAADPSVTLSVVAEPNELKADEKGVSQISVTATDANGNPVVGHKIRFLLATTSQYTGVVGGGAFLEQVGGTISEGAFGETDLFGRITTTYVAGFAAKTAVIVARDMVSNSTGAGYVKTFIQATASLELEPIANPAMDAGYEMVVTSSDEWLTADGKSQARITARVTLNGQPVVGHKVGFGLSGGGSIRVVLDTTGKDGEARAVYTAGKKIGIALITATDTTVGISGSVSIELRSDAPAKIAIKLDKDKLPADGRSTTDLTVLVTDINDNPNDNTEVEYAIISGTGRLRDEKGITDRKGENSTRYTAGRNAGTVTFGITVRSTVPTAEEILKARDLALAVQDSRFF